MVNEFKLTVVHCTPKPDADLYMRVDLPLGKRLSTIRTGPPGRRGYRRPRAVGRGPLGRWASGTPGGGGPWAAACF